MIIVKQPRCINALKQVAVFVLLICSGLSIGCSSAKIQRLENNWGFVTKGITSDDVEQLLGKPDARIGPLYWTPSEDIKMSLSGEIYETWVYELTGRNAIILSADNDDYAVYFDKEMRVISKQCPSVPTSK